MKSCISVALALGLVVGISLAKSNSDLSIGQYNVMYQGKPLGVICLRNNANNGWNYWYAVSVLNTSTGALIPAPKEAGRWGVLYAPHDTAGQIHFYGGSESAGYIDAMKFDANSLTGSRDRWYPTFRDGYFYEGATLQMAKHSCDPQPM